MICHVDFMLHYFVIPVYTCMILYVCVFFLFSRHYVAKRITYNNKISTDVAVLLLTDEVNAGRFEIARFGYRN